MNVYVASRVKYAAVWRSLRAACKLDGVNIISTWIDEAGEGDSPDMYDLWVRCIDEASHADALIAFHVNGDVWKGTFVEIGAALASGVRVYVVGFPPGSWTAHPLVIPVNDVFAAVRDILKMQQAGQTGGLDEREE